jgi:SAM-dependent methyltransferase
VTRVVEHAGPGAGELLAAWREQLAAWAIPESITAGVTESPWTLPRQMFVRRADRRRDNPSGPSFERAWRALDPPGTVLDVGAGAGAASLPLAARALSIVAVDADAELLSTMDRAENPVSVQTVHGRWPETADRVPVADVVTCHHVLYNVADVGPFVAALSARARRLVVLELTASHPLSHLNPLWEHFHGLRRPHHPTADDLLAILGALGLRPESVAWRRPAEAEFASFEDMVALTRRRVCLPPERTEELAAYLRANPIGNRERSLMTIWWPGSGS